MMIKNPVLKRFLLESRIDGIQCDVMKKKGTSPLFSHGE
jgi:hypothetical protein